MTDFIIVTDSCSDIPESYSKEYDIRVVPMSFVLNGEVYVDDLGKSLSYKDFYKAIDNGALPTTTQPSPEAFYRVFKEAIEEGKPVLYIGVSSSLSGTFNSSIIGKQMIQEEYPNAHIICFTTLSASSGQGLFIQEAVKMRKEGKTMEDTLAVLNEKRQKHHSLIMIEDLKHLKRGGRISNVQAAIGSILKIQPILQLDQEGKVQVVDKIRGKKKAFNHFAQYVLDHIENIDKQTIVICHSNSPQEAEKLQNAILNLVPVKNMTITSIGPVIGSHVGSGGLAVFFLN